MRYVFTVSQLNGFVGQQLYTPGLISFRRFTACQSCHPGSFVPIDFVPAAAPHDAWSSTIQMELSNGGSTEYRPSTGANESVLPAGGSTTLIWHGKMFRPYPGATSLTLSILDSFTDASGPYTSELQNVSVTIYPAVTAATIWVASDCTSVTKPCSLSLAQAARDIAIGGRLSVVDTLASEDVTFDKDVILESDGTGVITGNGGSAPINITGGTVYIQNLAINRGASTNAVSVADGSEILRGNTIDGGGATGIVHSGGTVNAYANNVINTGGAGVSGTVSAPKNWWGTAVDANQPGGVAAGDWLVRLGTDVISAAFNEGDTVILGDAQLVGPGPGTGVIIDFGSGMANAPFGVGEAPYANQTCSNYYDFYSTGGAGWTVVLSINSGLAGCSTNVLAAQKTFMISDISQCASALSTECWDLIPAGQITTNGNNLEISGLSLAGTHIVAGESGDGADLTVKWRSWQHPVHPEIFS